jgi:hypothetical protein
MIQSYPLVRDRRSTSDAIIRWDTCGEIGCKWLAAHWAGATRLIVHEIGRPMTHEDIAAWESFAVAMAGASAVLAGLVFVAVSINIDRILRVQGPPGRAGESVILLVAAVCECAFVLVAHQAVTALAIELVVAGALTCAVVIAILVATLRRPNRQPSSWHATRAISVLACTIPIARVRTHRRPNRASLATR